ncbi:MAG TPA: hypothetical protein VK348_03525 [Planctomycetota bacterium]|nr:hypothetical protein [Planctomycetota bacterium]
MDPHIEAALRAIDQAEREVRALPPMQLTDEYLRHIRAVEALPENQDGADKSWVWPAYEYCRRHFLQFEIE